MKKELFLEILNFYKIENSYFYEMRKDIQMAIDYLLYIKYIKEYTVSVKNSLFKKSKPVKAIKYKSIK